MTIEYDDLARFQDAYLDYLEGDCDEPPALEDLQEEQRPAATAFINSITAARGVDPRASRPSIEQLLDSWAQSTDPAGKLAEVLEEHLRLSVDPRAVVTRDVASAAVGLASSFVIQARGMRMRVVQEPTSERLETALASRAEDIAKVFSAFPDSHVVLYTTTGQEPHAVVLDRGEVEPAIETPSGERRTPRMRRSVAAVKMACEVWLKGIIPEFEPLSTDLLEPTTATASAVDPRQLANEVVREVSAAGVRARVEAKRDTWRGFGDLEAQHLTGIVEEAQRGHMSEEAYKSRLDALVRVVA